MNNKKEVQISQEDYEFLRRLACKLNKSVQEIIHMLVRFLRLIKQRGIPDDLGYFLQHYDEKLLDLLLELRGVL